MRERKVYVGIAYGDYVIGFEFKSGKGLSTIEEYFRNYASILMATDQGGDVEKGMNALTGLLGGEKIEDIMKRPAKVLATLNESVMKDFCDKENEKSKKNKSEKSERDDIVKKARELKDEILKRRPKLKELDDSDLNVVEKMHKTADLWLMEIGLDEKQQKDRKKIIEKIRELDIDDDDIIEKSREIREILINTMLGE